MITSSINQKIEHITVKNFKTTDGKVFNDLLEAQKHQEALEIKSEKEKKEELVKTQVKDLLNQIVLVTKGTGDNGSFLNHVQLYCERVLKNEWEADDYENKYHSSHCY